MLPSMQFAAPVIGPPDYDWETNGSSKGSPTSTTDGSSSSLGANNSVSCVSLGSYCAVASCLTHLKLREAAFPFDWNRTTIQGVVHFLKSRFSDFLQFFLVKDFVGGKDTGGKAYCGVHHSVWHENLGSGDGQAKYQRRIERLYENKAERLLFIRSLNSSDELAAAQELLSTLESIFPKSRVYLLLIVTCQRESRQYFVSGLNRRLIVHFLPGWSIDGLAFSEAILSAHRHASCDGGCSDSGNNVNTTSFINNGSSNSCGSKSGSRQSSCSSVSGSKAANSWLPAETPMVRVVQEMHCFYGGPPQHVPFNPEVPYFYPGMMPSYTTPGDLLQTAVSPAQGGYRAQPYAAATGPPTAPASASASASWNNAVPWAAWGQFQQQQSQQQQQQQQQQEQNEEQGQQQNWQQNWQWQPQQQQLQQQQLPASYSRAQVSQLQQQQQQQQHQQSLAPPLAPVAAVAPMLAQWAVKPAVATAAARHLGTSSALPLPPPATGLATPTEFAPTWAY
eukprot:CAMPEP_0206557908 /NCGR_PEP_ID=MMETSP0325_2-20121206/19423_1 /ASSEMBLY_ACC=CAM_ASM_000347 /TAXON_ID=2866 /ORGANISM="Crypthecodinium cohnii, Strain Seligo" /LENGTH=505 /DNA_ID=CAMNT_0054058997 /DNA_START=146 /DNA_END=1663 /DNA_ORIENTATION=+